MWQRELICLHIALHCYASGLNPLASSVNQDSRWTIKPSHLHCCKAGLFITQGADEVALWKTAHLINDKYLSHLVKICMLIKELRKEFGKKHNTLVQRLNESKHEFQSFSGGAREREWVSQMIAAIYPRFKLSGTNFSLEASWHFRCIHITAIHNSDITSR